MSNYSSHLIAKIGGMEIKHWMNYDFTSSILEPADGFNLSIALPDDAEARQKIRSKVIPGAEVQLYVDTLPHEKKKRQPLQLTGFVDTVSVSTSRNSAPTLEVSGRDLVGNLLDSSMPWQVANTKKRAFIDIVKDVVLVDIFGWKIKDVLSDGSASRSIRTGAPLLTDRGKFRARERRKRARSVGAPASATSEDIESVSSGRKSIEELYGTRSKDELEERLENARSGKANGFAPSEVKNIRQSEAIAQAGESVWEYLTRHAKRLGLMMWLTPDGKLVVGAPDYNSAPTHKLINKRSGEGNNIISLSLNLSADYYTEVRVFGKTWGNDSMRSRFVGTAEESDFSGARLSYRKTLYVQDSSIRSKEEAEALAKRTLAEYRSERFSMTVTVPGHHRGGVVYAADTVVEVDDEDTGVRGKFYVTGVTMSGGRDQAATTELRLVELNSIVLK